MHKLNTHPCPDTQIVKPTESRRSGSSTPRHERSAMTSHPEPSLAFSSSLFPTALPWHQETMGLQPVPIGKAFLCAPNPPLGLDGARARRDADNAPVETGPAHRRRYRHSAAKEHHHS